MVILHIAALNNSPFSGVSVVVPEHVKAQENYATVAIMNILDYKVSGVKIQLDNQTDIGQLPSPFNRPDIVVFHQLYYLEYLKIAKSLKRSFIPYIIVPHGCLSKDALKIKRLKKIIGNTLFFNSFIKKACALQCLSKGEASDIEYNNYKIISTNGFKIPDIKKDTFLQNGEIRIIYVGRLEIYHKGLDILIKALGKIKDSLLEKKVVLSFYGPNNNEAHAKLLDLINNENLEGIVSVHDGIVGAEKRVALLNSDFFVQTSRFEGMPMGILEAMSYGLPVLITEGTTLGSMVSKYDAGWVAETTIESVATSFIKAINDICNYQNKSKAARLLVSEEFEWGKIAKDAIEQYTHLLKEK